MRCGDLPGARAERRILDDRVRREIGESVCLGPATRDAHEHTAEVENDELDRRRRASISHRGSLRGVL
jgi:hypothetical protein